MESWVPVMPWLFMRPILYSALREGNRAAPIVIPSSIALNFNTIGFFSSPSGSWGNSLASTGVWLTLTSEGCGVGVSSRLGGGLMKTGNRFKFNIGDKQKPHLISATTGVVKRKCQRFASHVGGLTDEVWNLFWELMGAADHHAVQRCRMLRDVDEDSAHFKYCSIIGLQPTLRTI